MAHLAQTAQSVPKGKAVKLIGFPRASHSSHPLHSICQFPTFQSTPTSILLLNLLYDTPLHRRASAWSLNSVGRNQ